MPGKNRVVRRVSFGEFVHPSANPRLFDLPVVFVRLGIVKAMTEPDLGLIPDLKRRLLKTAKGDKSAAIDRWAAELGLPDDLLALGILNHHWGGNAGDDWLVSREEEWVEQWEHAGPSSGSHSPFDPSGLESFPLSWRDET